MRKANPMLSALVQAAQTAPTEQGERSVPSPEQSTRETLLGKQSGQALREVVEEKNARIAELESKVAAQEAAGHVTKLDPAKELIGSRYNPRLERRLRSAALAELLEEIREVGFNVQPILVRPHKRTGADGKEQSKYEIVYGHRRAKCCEILGLEVRSIVMDLTDQDVAMFQAQENEGQDKPSPFELGTSYGMMLWDQVFSSLRHLSEKIGVPLASAADRVLAARVGRPFEAIGLDATLLSVSAAQTLRDWFEGQGVSIAVDPPGAKRPDMTDAEYKKALAEADAGMQKLVAKAKELVEKAEVDPKDKAPFKVLAVAAKKWNRAPRQSPRQSFEVKGVGLIEVLAKPKATVVTIPGTIDIERLKSVLADLQ